MKALDFIQSIFMFIGLSLTSSMAFSFIKLSDTASFAFGIILGFVLFILWKISDTLSEINKKLK